MLHTKFQAPEPSSSGEEIFKYILSCKPGPPPPIPRRMAIFGPMGAF